MYQFAFSFGFQVSTYDVIITGLVLFLGGVLLLKEIKSRRGKKNASNS